MRTAPAASRSRSSPARGRVRLAALFLRITPAQLWQAFDRRCRVRVKLGAGTLVRGRIGPPGEERADVYGDVLNQLYKASGEEFLILPGLAALLA